MKDMTGATESHSNIISMLYNPLDQSQLWNPDLAVKLRYNEDIYRIDNSMFAPPTLPVKGRGTDTTSSSYDHLARHRPAAATVNRRQRVVTQRSDELCGWRGSPAFPESREFEDGYFGITDWTAMVNDSDTQSLRKANKAPLPNFRVIGATTDRCTQLEISSANEPHSTTGLSEYLRNLKLLLSRSKPLSAGANPQNSMRFYNQSQLYTRQITGGSSSAPTTTGSILRKHAQRSYKFGVQASSSTTNSTSDIPCKNYNKLHKHKSYSDLRDCCYRAKLDNQYNSCGSQYHTESPRKPRKSGSVDNSNCVTNNGSKSPSNRQLSEAVSKENRLITVNIEPSPRVTQEREPSKLVPVGIENSGYGENTSLTKEHTTMQEYIEKYYQAPSKVPGSPHKKTLPAIADKNHRLVENIMNYRHSTTREREATHKNRYLQLTAMDIRRTTAQLLKSSLHRHSPYRTPSGSALQGIDSISDSVTANLTLTQLMAPKATTQVFSSKLSGPSDS